MNLHLVKRCAREAIGGFVFLMNLDLVKKYAHEAIGVFL